MYKITIAGLMILIFITGCSTKAPLLDLTTNKVATYNVKDYQTKNESKNNYSHSIISSNSETIGEIISTKNIIENNNIIINSKLQSIYFDFDKFEITDEMRSTILLNKQFLKNKVVKLEGNCDDFGSDEYNLALGLKRANEIKKELIRNGFSESYIKMVSYGESNQVCTERTEECFAKNRRVDFVLTDYTH